MRLKKWISVFLAAAITISILPESGRVAYASENLENMEEETEQKDTEIDRKEEQTESLYPGGTEKEDTPEGQEKDVLEEESEETQDVETEAPQEDQQELEKDVLPEELVEEVTEENETVEEFQEVEEMESEGETKNETAEVQLFFATDDIANGVSNNITWRIDANGKLIVSGTGDASALQCTDWPWYRYRDCIISAEVTVTDMTYASGMFYECSNLISLDLKNFDTSEITDMSVMFYECRSLSSLDLNNFITSNVSDMWKMFAGCSSIISLDLSNFDASGVEDRNVENMEDMFSDCNSLRTIYTPYNVSASSVLPLSTESEFWILPDGTKITELPKNLDHSVMITRMTKEDISSAEVRLVADRFVYTGSAVEPDISVIYAGKTLRKGVDYTVSYHNNIQPGTAEIHIEGTGSYSGMLTVSFEIENPVLNGWIQDENKWYYYIDNIRQTGWKQIAGKWYYMDSKGVMATGWQQVSGRWYYMKESGAMTTGWQQVSGKWYYMKESGAMATGWQQISGKWYYMKESGAMATGWQQVSGKWYYMKESGAMATGWQQVSGKWYYMKESGAMATGWQQVSGRWYYMNGSGAMTTGWQKISGKWYYMKESGAMATGWQQVSDRWYYMNKSGEMKTGSLKSGDVEYYFDNKGVMMATVPTQNAIIKKFSEIPWDVNMANTYATAPNTKKPYAAGALSDKSLKNAVNCVNFVRYVAGIPSDVKLDKAYSEMAQTGALVNAVNNTLSHYPQKPSGFPDDLYNTGFTGCRSSNIARGYQTLAGSIVNGWLDDGDRSNIDRLGHRRWILNPTMTATGFGAAGSFSAMYALDHSWEDRSEVVVWPARNMPVELITNTGYPWSVSVSSDYQLPAAKDIKVTMRDVKSGKVWTFDQKNCSFDDNYFSVNSDSYGTAGCIIFRPNTKEVKYTAGSQFEITITGTKDLNGNDKPIQYTVKFFSLSKNGRS